MNARSRMLALLVSAVALVGCAELAPLRDRPVLSTASPMEGVTTRAQALARLGRPSEVRASDVGEVLVYRRAAVVDVNPNRYYGQDRGNRLDRYEHLLVHVDRQGRVVRWSIEPE